MIQLIVNFCDVGGDRMTNIRKMAYLFLGFIFLLSQYSCDKQETVSEPAGEVMVQEAVETVPASSSSEALVTFLTGEVLHLSDEGDRVPEIGDSIAAGEKIETGQDGYVELQFGTLGAIRIQADTSYLLEIIESNNEGERVSGTLTRGSILAKLTNEDRFEVGIPGAVCAVRGTEFLIRADERGSVTIAVAEGSVVVSPPSLAEIRTDSVTNESLTEIRSLMPIVSANEELVMTSDTLAAAEIELAAWSEDEAGFDQVQLDLLATRVRSVLVDVPTPESLRPENKEILLDETPVLLPAATETSPSLVPLTVRTSPSDSIIYINNQSAGRGIVSRVFEEGTPISILAVTPDGRRIERELFAGTESLIEIEFEEIGEPETPDSVESQAEPKAVETLEVAVTTDIVTDSQDPMVETVGLSVVVEQNDAAVFVNGSRLGTGRAQFEGRAGEQIVVSVERSGFATFKQRITLGSVPDPLRISLEPRQFAARTRLPDEPAIGTLSGSGNAVVGITAQGTIYAVNEYGKVIWKHETENRDGENSTPVIDGNRVYVTGNSELLIVNLANGRILGRQPLEGDRADIFGRQLLAWNNHLILPSDSSLVFLHPETGEAVESLNIPNGSRMSPAAWNQWVITVDQRGTLLYIDPEEKTVVRTVTTGATQPIGPAPAISRNGIAVFSGRRGTVSAVDLKSSRVIWERELDPGGPVRVHTGTIINDGVVFIYGDGAIYAMDLGTGDSQFAPIPGVSAPPLIRDGIIYLCREDGIFSMHNQSNGGQIGEIHLNEASSVRPAGLGPFVVVAGEQSIFVLDPRSMTE